MPDQQTLFDVEGQRAVLTGSVMARALAKAGVCVTVLNLHAAASAKVVETKGVFTHDE